MIERVVTDHGVLREYLLLGPYLVAFISSKSGCYWRGESKREKNKREEEKKDGEKQKWENSSSAANQEDKRVFHPQWYSSIQLFPR